VFRWEALAGILKSHVNGTMPRHASPCGTTIDRDATQLMYLPDRFFPALKVEPPVVEALLYHFILKVSQSVRSGLWRTLISAD
jgi:hypothetical protein